MAQPTASYRTDLGTNQIRGLPLTDFCPVSRCRSDNSWNHRRAARVIHKQERIRVKRPSSRDYSSSTGEKRKSQDTFPAVDNKRVKMANVLKSVNDLSEISTRGDFHEAEQNVHFRKPRRVNVRVQIKKELFGNRQLCPKPDVKDSDGSMSYGVEERTGQELTVLLGRLNLIDNTPTDEVREWKDEDEVEVGSGETGDVSDLDLSDITEYSLAEEEHRRNSDDEGIWSGDESTDFLLVKIINSFEAKRKREQDVIKMDSLGLKI